MATLVLKTLHPPLSSGPCSAPLNEVGAEAERNILINKIASVSLTDLYFVYSIRRNRCSLAGVSSVQALDLVESNHI